jgi:hypothetical protein
MTRLDPTDDQLTRRLGDALAAENRRHSLPTDFATSVSETLPNRAPRAWWSLATAPSFAATLVVGVAAVALVLAISPRLIGLAPGSSSEPSVSSEPSPVADLAHYDHDGISFDHPAAIGDAASIRLAGHEGGRARQFRLADLPARLVLLPHR